MSATTRPIRLVLAGVAATALALTGAVPAAATGATTDVLVPASDFGSTYAAANQKTWLVEQWSGGTHQIGAAALASRDAIEMTRASTGSVVNVFRSFGAGVRPTAIAPLLDGASYTYSGDNVNFQFAMFYTPADSAAYGPAGSTAACTQAVDDGSTVAGKCFTILKFEPGATSTTDYLTYTLDDVQQPFGGGTDAGWWPTRQVGPYSATNRTGTLDQLLAQMADYEIYAVGASVGSGTPAGTSSLLQMTFGGQRYTFGTEPAAKSIATPPAADTAALLDFLASEGVEPDQDTSSFGTSADLDAVDPNAPFTGTLPWSDPSDAFVDVYSYSSAFSIGAFRVSGGRVSLNGIDLSHLRSGTHSLLFVGQTSRSIGAITFTVRPAALAATGTDTTALALVAAPIALLGVALVAWSRRGSRSAGA